MRVYFPPRDEGRPPDCLFQQDLSSEEQEQLQEAAEACLNLLERYVRDEETGCV